MPGLARMICPRSPSRSDEDTKYCPGRPKNSRGNQRAVMEAPSARAMGQSFSRGRTCQKLYPIPTSRRLRFVLC